MKQLITLLLLTFSSQLVFSQSDDLQLASSFFPKEKAKVLVVGTFHFDFPGMGRIDKVTNGWKWVDS